jgi:tRNA(Ser,Leu) C12 N-acetylase TAN1
MVQFYGGISNVKVFISRPRTIEELKRRIKEEIAVILKQRTLRVMENCRGKLEQCSRNSAGHLNDEIFKNKIACTEFFGDSNVYIVR